MQGTNSAFNEISPHRAGSSGARSSGPLPEQRFPRRGSKEPPFPLLSQIEIVLPPSPTGQVNSRTKEDKNTKDFSSPPSLSPRLKLPRCLHPGPAQAGAAPPGQRLPGPARRGGDRGDGSIGDTGLSAPPKLWWGESPGLPTGCEGGNYYTRGPRHRCCCMDPGGKKIN